MTTPSPAPESAAQARPQRSGIVWALLGIVLVVAGVVAYFVWLGQPLLRTTGLPIWIGGGLGLACSLLAWQRDGRLWVRLVALLSAGLVGLLALLFFVAARLPEASGLAKLETAPDFQLTNHEGQTVSLADSVSRGPTLLVFYRGHW